MPNKGKFIGGQDNLFVPDAPTIGDATAGNGEVSVAFTAPSDVGNEAITLYGASVFLAGATINYRVSVGTGTLSTGGSGNVYFIDGIPTKTLSLIKGFTYVFDLSDGSNSGHPFGFKNASDGAYTTGVTTSGTAGNASATVTLVLATDASEPSRYYCTSHGNGMGNTISLIEASASTDPLGAAQAGTTGSSSPITVTGLSNGTSYIAQVWAINGYGNGPLSAATSSFSPSAPLAFFCTGSGGDLNKRNITSLGNFSDNGNIILHEARSGIASSTRGIFTSGKTIGSNDPSTKIRYFTIATGGGLSVFGDLSVATRRGFGVASSTRGITAGGFDVNSGTGQPGNVNHISFVTIASTGDASDFGDLTAVGGPSGGGCSPTRAVFMGRFTTSSSANTIDFITIASAGNASDFGDMPGTRKVAAGASNSTRAITAGPDGNEIEYVTIASTGNAADFGNLTETNEGGAGAASSTRMLIAGGQGFGAEVDYITIASLGNASDFGNLTATTEPGSGGLSNVHGGLG